MNDRFTYINRHDIRRMYTWQLDEYGEFPEHFSENARRIVAAQYFRDGEDSFQQVVCRVVNKITNYGDAHGYFEDGEALDFAHKLATGIIDQRFSFNSPVWYNVGINEDPQCSACFIQSVDDSLESIMDLAKKEALLFKHGSGTGTNLSPLRSSSDRLSKSDGYASGPVSFMRMYDAVAGTIKSGGRTRRAAKMQLLDASHPDIDEFVMCKAMEDSKAKDLIDAGWSPVDAYDAVGLQNLNHSVRLTDKDMETRDALLWDIAEAAWECGDPGVQFTDTINRMHMVPSAGTINASNPCSEFVFLDETACNLASLNAVKYFTPDGEMDMLLLSRDVHTLITAMDILVDMAGYPTEEICRNSVRYRPLGLGITNVGALLMREGHAYDSDAGREVAATLMEKVHFFAAQKSGQLAMKFGQHHGYDPTVEIPILQQQLNGNVPKSVLDHGLRNAQLTVIAPTGTISFMMDCESTGCEPVLAPSQTKHLAGGGELTIEPECVTLGSKHEDQKVMQTALGINTVSTDGHLKMVAALQKHVSGAISKTINMPSTATVDDVYRVFRKAHEAGIKCITVYRDGCKSYQPLTTTKEPAPESNARVRLPDERQSVTHKFNIGGVEGYMTVGLYEDGRPGELFVKIAKEGSTASGFMDSWAAMVSILLQHGLPVSKVVEKFKGMAFEPHGLTTNPDVPIASSIPDYIVRWLDVKFGEGLPVGLGDRDADGEHTPATEVDWGGETCPDCGGMLHVTGTCKTCKECGWGGGCG